MTPTRFKVLKYFMLKNGHNVSLSEMMRFFFAKSYDAKAKKIVGKVEMGESYNKIYFKGIEKPLYYPSSFPVSSLNMVICESFYSSNWHYYEIPETKVTENDIVVDCGAAEGLFGFLVVNRCAKLYLIEPLNSYCKSLSETFSENNNVEVLQLGISDKEGVATINENDISSSLSVGSGNAVKVTTLDKLFFEKDVPVSYIKIDVEGFDFKVLNGARELIKKNKPKIAVTTYHNVDHAQQIKDLLLSIVPEYTIHTKGIFQETGSPVMLHAWV